MARSEERERGGGASSTFEGEESQELYVESGLTEAGNAIVTLRIVFADYDIIHAFDPETAEELAQSIREAAATVRGLTSNRN